MRQNSFILILSLSLVTLLGACAGHKQTAKNNGAEKLGTGDSGGGNLYKGRPIESYKIDITQLPSYKSKVAPIVEALTDLKRTANGKQLSNPDLGRMFQSILTKRSWYMIPGDLEILPKERTGIAVPSEQGALQSAKEIWVNSNLFNAMFSDDQGTLILHEVLMGIRLLKFASDREQCLSYTTDPNYCSLRTTPNGDITQLTPNDYAEIRASGVEIMKSYPQLTYEAWDDLMARYNYSMSTRNFPYMGDQGEIATEKVIGTIKRAQVAQRGPTYGYSTYPTRVVQNQGACQVELVETTGPAKYEFKLKTPKESRNFVFDELASKATLSYGRYVLFNQTRITQVRLTNMPAYDQAKVGDRFFAATLLFDLDTWVGVEVVEQIVTEVTKNGNSSSVQTEDLQSGFSYQCLIYPSIEYN